MHALRAGALHHIYDSVDVEVALGGGSAADVKSLVGFSHELRMPICVGIDRYCADIEPTSGAHDSSRDFAAVRHQELFDDI